MEYSMISYRYGSETVDLRLCKPQGEDDNTRYWRELPSVDARTPMAPKKVTYKTDHTIAPAYNKGPYQVISSQNIKDIGK
jgi:hypothetical protein